MPISVGIAYGGRGEIISNGESVKWRNARNLPHRPTFTVEKGSGHQHPGGCGETEHRDVIGGHRPFRRMKDPIAIPKRSERYDWFAEGVVICSLEVGRSQWAGTRKDLYASKDGSHGEFAAFQFHPERTRLAPVKSR